MKFLKTSDSDRGWLFQISINRDNHDCVIENVEDLENSPSE
jgi:hypothetical protein